MRIDELVQSWMKERRVGDLYILARFTYRVGYPIMEDGLYDKLEEFCRKYGIAEEYFDRTYDEDPIPYDLLREADMESIVPMPEEAISEYYDYFNEEKTLSIHAVTEYSEAYEYFKSVKGYNLLLSIKMDGMMTKRLIQNHEQKIGLSRGRKGEAWDLSKTILNCVPRFYPTFEGEVKVYAEGYVVPEALDYLREKYDPNAYKTSKSSAISMLRVMKDPEDYQYLKVLTFSAEGLGTKQSEVLEKCKAAGLDVVPHIKVNGEEPPLNSLEEFIPWLRNKLDLMNVMGEGIPSDGVVVSVDDESFSETVNRQYSNRNIALKLEHWSFDYYPAIVDSIVTEQRRVMRSAKVKIVPFIAKDRTEAKVINCFNPNILIENGIVKGSRIYFERNSGAVNILIHGGRLGKLDLQTEES